MEKFKTGDRIVLKESVLSVSYIACRRSYTAVYEGKPGRVIGYAGTGKVAIEFDAPVFINSSIKLSSHDNGCHGKGKMHHCWYIPEQHLELVTTSDINPCHLLLL